MGTLVLIEKKGLVLEGWPVDLYKIEVSWVLGIVTHKYIYIQYRYYSFNICISYQFRVWTQPDGPMRKNRCGSFRCINQHHTRWCKLGRLPDGIFFRWPPDRVSRTDGGIHDTCRCAGWEGGSESNTQMPQHIFSRIGRLVKVFRGTSEGRWILLFLMKGQWWSIPAL